MGSGSYEPTSMREVLVIAIYFSLMVVASFVGSLAGAWIGEQIYPYARRIFRS